MQREQELLFDHAARVGMRNLVGTAMRTIPLHRRMDPFHGVDSPGQLPRLSIPLDFLVLGSNGWLLRVAQPKSTTQQISSSLSFSEFFRGVFSHRPGLQIASGIHQHRERVFNSLLEHKIRGISAQLLHCNGGEPGERREEEGLHFRVGTPPPYCVFLRRSPIRRNCQN